MHAGCTTLAEQQALSWKPRVESVSVLCSQSVRQEASATQRAFAGGALRCGLLPLLRCCRVTLEVASGPLAGQAFMLELPPPSRGHAEFVILRSHFEASVRRPWPIGSRCKVGARCSAAAAPAALVSRVTAFRSALWSRSALPRPFGGCS
jgi:hypothetical protein